MKKTFITDITKVIEETGGDIFIDPTEECFNMSIGFQNEETFILDYLNFKQTKRDTAYGVMVRSCITQKQFVSIFEYTYFLVQWLEAEFNTVMEMKPFTACLFFIGEIKIKKINNEN